MLRSALYAMRGGFLVRPLLIALVFGAVGAILSFAEEYIPELDVWIPEVLFPAHQDPQVALSILSGIASSIMTVVSIVFAILLMTLTLASTQFSPRILVSFVRDRTTQWTLGIFRHFFLLHGRASVGAVVAEALRAGADGANRHGARAGLRRLAHFSSSITFRTRSASTTLSTVSQAKPCSSSTSSCPIRGDLTRDRSRRRLPIRENSASSSVASRDMCAMLTSRF
jgi:hypothetical protein